MFAVFKPQGSQVQVEEFLVGPINEMSQLA
jgi:hypothetical protein